MKFSIIVPAFNEEAYLAATLDSIQSAAVRLRARSELDTDVIVVDYRPRRLFMRLYLRAWRLVARLTGMAQGATQFCRRSVLEQVGGYDERAWIGEDVDFYRSLKRLAKRSNRTVRFIRNMRVRPSSRRFDKWPIWKILIWTNPLFIALFRRRKRVWSGWYSRAVR